MDSQLYAALLGLGLVVIASVGAIVKALTDRVLTDLSKNTALTRKTSEATNGRLEEALDDLAVQRNLVVALRHLVRERDDRIAYLQSRLPQANKLLAEYGRSRENRHSRTEEHAALQRLLDDVDALPAGPAGPRER